MSIDYSSFPIVSQDLLEELEQMYPIKLSGKEDDDFDRGVMWGRQDVINRLKAIRKKQTNK